MRGCAALAELLGPWADGELDPSLGAEMEQHVRGCPSCARAAEAFGRLDDAAASAFTTPPVSEARWDEVWRGIDREIRRPRARALSRARVWGFAAAAVVLLCAGAVAWRLRPARPVAVYADLRPGVVEYVEGPSDRYVTMLSAAEGEVPVVYVTEVQ